MNTTLRDALAKQINAVGPAHLDVDELVGLGEQRLRRRRRLTAALGSAAAVVVVIALAIGGAALNRSADPGPTDTPNTDHQKTDDDTTPPNVAQAREIVYSDVAPPGPEGSANQPFAVHFGDQVVETGEGSVHMVVTDDGFVYTRDDRVWFSAGGTPELIGSHLCDAGAEGYHSSTGAVVSANTGSLVAWFDCTQAAQPTLVVYDTASRREVARRQMAFCRAFRELENCSLNDGAEYYSHGIMLTSDPPAVYFSHTCDACRDPGRVVDRLFRFDVRTQRLRASTPQEYAEDVRSDPRGLVVGDTWQTGTATNGIYQFFRVVGSRLLPEIYGDPDSERDLAKAAFDTATGRAVRLRVPPGYHTDDAFILFEWLDDNTVALVGGSGDILTCQLSDGRCVVAVGGPNADTWRVIPHLWLPG